MSAHALPVVHLTTEPSRSLLYWLLTVHGLALLAAVANDWPLWARGAAILAVMTSAGFSKRDYARTARLNLTLDPEGHVDLTGSADTLTGQILDSSVVTVWLVLLQIKTATGRRSILICRDATDPESFRLLRVALHCLPVTSREPFSVHF